MGFIVFSYVMRKSSSVLFSPHWYTYSSSKQGLKLSAIISTKWCARACGVFKEISFCFYYNKTREMKIYRLSWSVIVCVT